MFVAHAVAEYQNDSVALPGLGTVAPLAGLMRMLCPAGKRCTSSSEAKELREINAAPVRGAEIQCPRTCTQMRASGLQWWASSERLASRGAASTLYWVTCLFQARSAGVALRATSQKSVTAILERILYLCAGSPASCVFGQGIHPRIFAGRQKSLTREIYCALRCVQGVHGAISGTG